MDEIEMERLYNLSKSVKQPDGSHRVVILGQVEKVSDARVLANGLFRQQFGVAAIDVYCNSPSSFVETIKRAV